ncbi:MAG: citrate lyase acyl carrier protein [Tenericutes bacterium GWD2_38_27]|nr:MAG: citrate lyase acyl carrier protein [Tenericutes bacterium GWD2_38_27]HBG33394.1 citrate lyase acyl carrier protein [Acholeplasmataceae bacterium]HCB66137.1 citrate lyase acyl carrier protein [Acholeplasmataceae bacterium]
MKIASAGTMESNDCMMTVREHAGIQIEIESIVLKQFGKQIEYVIRETLKELNIENIFVQCNDKGALDYTVKARLVTAIQRMGEKHA